MKKDYFKPKDDKEPVKDAGNKSDVYCGKCGQHINHVCPNKWSDSQLQNLAAEVHGIKTLGSQEKENE